MVLQPATRAVNIRPLALIFDAYGTLFDVASVADVCAGRAPDPVRLIALWRTKQLEYSFLRCLTGAAAYVDFWEVTSDALDFAAQRLGLRLSAADREAALQGWLQVRPYADVQSSLERLSAGRTCMILSNGSPSMLREAVHSAGLAGRFQAVLSVDVVHVYKPSPRVYQLAVDAIGLPTDQLMFVSSNGWDAAGARAFGLPVAWINRSASPVERPGFAPSAVLPDLAMPR